MSMHSSPARRPPVETARGWSANRGQAMTDSYARGDPSGGMLDETIGANLDRAVARFGDREAVVSCAQGRRYTYAELGSAVDELARALMAAGVATGDRVGI